MKWLFRLPWIALTPALGLAAEPESASPEPAAAATETPQEPVDATNPASEAENVPSDPQEPTAEPASIPLDPATAAEFATAAQELATPSEPLAPASAPPSQLEPVDLSAPDTLGGHIRIALNGQASFPAGNIADDVPMTRSLSTNFIAGLDLAFGVSRHLTLGLTADYQTGYSTTECAACSSQGFGAGLLLRHHLTQGLRFDPWLAFGLGVRALDIRAAEETSNFVSVEWLRLQVGGDFFVAPPIGVGPIIDFALSSAVKTPTSMDPGDVGVRFGLGLRAVFDLPGRGR